MAGQLYITSPVQSVSVLKNFSLIRRPGSPPALDHRSIFLTFQLPQKCSEIPKIPKLIFLEHGHVYTVLLESIL